MQGAASGVQSLAGRTGRFLRVGGLQTALRPPGELVSGVSAARGYEQLSLSPLASVHSALAQHFPSEQLFLACTEPPLPSWLGEAALWPRQLARVFSAHSLGVDATGSPGGGSAAATLPPGQPNSSVAS